MTVETNTRLFIFYVKNIFASRNSFSHRSRAAIPHRLRQDFAKAREGQAMITGREEVQSE